MIVSPIFYMGCKRQLINDGLVDLFPNKINTFYEPFSGSAIVSMNVKAERYELSDINHRLIELYNLFKNLDSSIIINHIRQRIDEYNLPTVRTKRDGVDSNDLDKLRTEYKDSYSKFRDYYNIHRNPLDFLTLSYFSFSQQFRFNKDGDFNMPLGNDIFSYENEKYIFNGCRFFKRDMVHFCEKSFRDIETSSLNENDFVYFDPPYANTNATYNEGNRECGGWTIDDDYKLFNLIEDLNSRNIKWGMSNVFENRGNVNNHIKQWCLDNDWNVIHFDKKYSVNGYAYSNTDEVFICNYDVYNKGLFE